MSDTFAITEQPEIRSLAKQVTDTINLATTAVVETAEHDEWATAVLAEIARHRKHAEDLRLQFTRPLNESLKAINGFFRSLDEPLADADRSLRQKVLAYRQIEQRRIAEEQARLKAERDAKEAAARAAITSPGTSTAEGQAALAAADEAHEAFVRASTAPTPTVKTVLGSTTVRRIMDFEVIDQAQIPAEYLQVSAEAVRAAIRRGVRDIPGVRIFEREILTVSGR